jgi:hypothetical protein
MGVARAQTVAPRIVQAGDGTLLLITNGQQQQILR